MSYLDTDAIKKVNTDSITTSVQNQVQSSKAKQNTDSTIIFDKKHAEENAKKLGLSTEQYLELINNPEFITLSGEEQIDFIQKYIAAKNTVQQEQPVPETETPTTKEVLPTEEPVAAETQKVAQETDSEFFDGKAFCDLKPEEQLEVYIEEYAKNQFLYKPKSKKDNVTINDWNNLDSKSKETMINWAREQVNKELEEATQFKDGIKKTFQNINKEQTNDYENKTLERKMQLLQAANNSEQTLRHVKAMSINEQSKLIIEYLTKVNAKSPEKLSHTDTETLTRYSITYTALEEELKAKGITNSELAIGNVLEIARENKISVATVTLKYLEKKEKENPATLNEIERSTLKELKAIPTDYLETYASKLPSDNPIEQSLLVECQENGSIRKRSSFDKKVSIIAEHAFEKYKDQPEQLKILLEEAIATGNLALAGAIVSKAYLNKDFQKLLVASRGDVQVVTAGHMEGLDEQGTEDFTKIILQESEKDPVRNEKLATAAAKSASDENFHIVAANLTGISDQTGITVADRINENTDEKTQMEWVKIAAPKLTEGARVYSSVNAYKLQANNQAEGTKLYLDNSIAATKALNNSGNLKLFAKEAQTAVFNNIQSNIEELLPEKQAIQELKTLTDQIPDCAVSNQLDMHKSMMGSKYKEAQTYAAGNVYKYDTSVQAEAIKAVYASGNTDAIDKVNNQLHKCDANAVKSIEKEVFAQLKAMEERHAEQISEFSAKKLLSMETARNPKTASEWTENTRAEKLAQYKETFIKGTPAKKFEMIRSLQGVWQQEVIGHIATFCPELLASLISSMGSALFQLQLSPEIRNKIMSEMLRVPDMQADALQYFKENPNAFGSDVKSTCAELLMEREDPALETPTIKKALPAEYNFTSKPDELVKNRTGEQQLWKRDKNGYYVC